MPKTSKLAPVVVVAVVLAVAAVVRAVFWHRLRFLTDEPYAAQLIPLALLRDDPLRSVWNFHSQPPLFNLFVAAILHAAPAHEALALRLAMVGLGLLAFSLLALALLAVTRRPWVAIVGAAAVAVLPSALAYESWLFYAQLELACTAAIAFVIARIDGPDDTRAFAALGVAGLLLTLVRSAYHPVWLLALLLGWAGTRALCARRDPGAARTAASRRQLMLAALFAACALAWPAKNAVQFGFFGNSSWLGMSLAKIAVYPQPYETRLKWVQEGSISHYTLSAPFLPIAQYNPPPPDAPPAHPVLALPLNDARYVAVSKQLSRDALWVIGHAPGSYLATVWQAMVRFFEPTTFHSAFMNANMPALAGYDAPFLALLYPGQHLVFAVLAYLVPLVVGLGTWLRALSGHAEARAGVRGWLLGGTLAYALLVFCCTEWGENNRFRYTLLPLIVFGDAWAAVQVARALRASRRS
ncbi:MAG: hypothetical protein ABW252_05715 [Polyangiales bacterium]